MAVFIDQCNREVFIADKVQRIISLVPSQTELLFDLGLNDKIQGITKFCIHPSGLKKTKSIVGGTKSLHLDKIKALNPDLIIANKEENNRSDIESLAKNFPVWVSDVNNLEDALQMISKIGIICSCSIKAEEIKENIEQNFAELTILRREVSCLYFIWQNPYMLAAKNTFIHDMLSKCGFKNMALQIEGRYPQITEEEIKNLHPDILLLSSEPFPFKEKHLSTFKKKFPLQESFLVDGEYFSWYGSRLIKSVYHFNKFINEVEKCFRTNN